MKRMEFRHGSRNYRYLGAQKVNLQKERQDNIYWSRGR